MKLSLFALFISVAVASDEIAILQHMVDPVLSSSNLLDSDDFFVCGSKVPGMNGHYVLQSSGVVQSDPDTPVFLREDDDQEDKVSDETTDFRLFRHNGFWMIADVEPWPPVTHFRCDPTKTEVIKIDVIEVCGMGQSTPPRIGYSAADPRLGDVPLSLQTQDCMELDDATTNNFSISKEEL